MSHTPGPWKVDYRPDEYGPDFIKVYEGTWSRGGIRKIADISNRRGNGIDNARLIAAAPDLLELAKMLVSYRDRAGAINFQLEKADTYIDLLRAAIAKAEPLAPMTRNTGKGEGQEVTP